MVRTYLLSLLLASSFLPVAPAAAQDDDARYAAARARFERAQSDFDDGNFALAADGFGEAYEMMDGHPNRHLVLYNLALCYDESGALEQALETYRRFLREAGSDQRNVATANARVAELERRRDLRGGAGGGDGGDLLVGLGAGLLGLGAAGLVTMGIFGGLALAEDDALSSGCGATASCTADDVSDADTFAVVADVGLTVGAVAAAAGLVLLIVGLTSGGDDSPPTAFIAPQLGETQLGILAQWSVQ